MPSIISKKSSVKRKVAKASPAASAPKQSKVLNRIIAAANVGYSNDGIIGDNWNAATSTPVGNAPECGDTLALFVVLELSEVSRGEKLAGAVDVSLSAIARAIKELQGVYCAIAAIDRRG